MATNKGFPVKLSRPAQRALANAGISTLKQVPEYSPDEIAGLHGVELTTIAALKKALAENGLSFSKNKKAGN
ncbi:MAG TPA: hypothetical protein VGO58_11775 [Chitinophagaceae bacterium]|jgi:hypothetical protein|nr:hypothetical protein [Chitinophagaceae bacterium]